MLGLLQRWIVSIALVTWITAFGLAATNVALYFAFKVFPNWSETSAERITREFNLRFGQRQGEQAMKWLAIKDEAELNAFFAENSEHALIGNVYEDFTGFKTTPWKGRFFNFRRAGYREVVDQGPWPPSRQFFNIFFFGGSTTMGIGPDWATIPSYLQTRLKGQRFDGKEVRVYNFGRGSYFSTQERILFQQLILRKRVPNMVIFLDGLNDFYFIDGRPSGWEYFDRAFMRASSRVNVTFAAMLTRLDSLPMVRAAKIVADKLSHEDSTLPIYKPEQASRSALDAAIDRYLDNKRQIEGIAHAYGISPLFVWQPIPGYKYDLRYDISLNPVYGLGGHERSAQGYPIAARRRVEFGDDFLWLADIQEDKKAALYMDAVHYTAEFSDQIATQIVAAMLKGAQVGDQPMTGVSSASP